MVASDAYRYGFNGQEKDDEVAGKGNSNTAMFWQYDARLGRRWNPDPKPNPSISNNACFANSPLFYTDLLGDTLRGQNATSGQRMLDGIHDSFEGDEKSELRGLFKLESDGMTMAQIDEAEFKSAISELDEDTQALANAYYLEINGNRTHTIEIVKRSEPLSLDMQNIFKKRGFKTGEHVDSGGPGIRGAGGGVNLLDVLNNKSYSVLVMDSQKSITDRKRTDGNRGWAGSTVSTLLAHEVLGHGSVSFKFLLAGQKVAHDNNSNISAIQMSNLALRVLGKPEYRTGASHNQGVAMNSATVLQVPNKFQISSTLKLELEKIVQQKKEQRAIKLLKERSVNVRDKNSYNLVPKIN